MSSMMDEVHTDGCNPPRGLKPYGLGFSHYERPVAVIALPVTCLLFSHALGFRICIIGCVTSVFVRDVHE
jgi:hypothetical protein